MRQEARVKITGYDITRARRKRTPEGEYERLTQTKYYIMTEGAREQGRAREQERKREGDEKKLACQRRLGKTDASRNESRT